MTSSQPLELLSLPSPSVTRLSQPAVKDTIQYFNPDIITISGPRDATAYAQVREAAAHVPVWTCFRDRVTPKQTYCTHAIS